MGRDELLRAGTEPAVSKLTPPYACLEALQFGLGTGGRYDVKLADAYSAGATFFTLLTGSPPVCVTDEEEAAADDSWRPWEAALLRRVRECCAQRQHNGSGRCCVHFWVRR